MVGRSGARADEGVGPSTFGHLLAPCRDLARARLDLSVILGLIIITKKKRFWISSSSEQSPGCTRKKMEGAVGQQAQSL